MLDPTPHDNSLLAQNTLALILAYGGDNHLHELTEFQTKSAIYFGGNFRVIDFTLSNCINSGIRRIGVLAQYKSQTLMRHIMMGWGDLKKELGEYVEILPSSTGNTTDWHKSAVDAIYQNIDMIQAESPKYTLILSGDHIYQMDYSAILEHHVKHGSDVTIACIKRTTEEEDEALKARRIDHSRKVVSFDANQDYPHVLTDKNGARLSPMGSYVINTKFLIEQVCADAIDSKSEHNFQKNIIQKAIKNDNAKTFYFEPDHHNPSNYWCPIETIDSFWQANMDLVAPQPLLDLYNRDWPIWTYQNQLPPAKFVFDNKDRRGCAVDSIVSSGCIVSGSTIKKSVLFTEVQTHSYAKVEESVLMTNVNIQRHAKVRRAVIDSGCTIPEGMTIGYNQRDDLKRGFRVTQKGITLVTPTMLNNIHSPAKTASKAAASKTQKHTAHPY